MKETDLSLAVLLKVFKSYFWKMAKILLVILIITTGLFFVVPYKYYADSAILPPENDRSSGGLSSFLSSFSSGGGAGLLGAATGGVGSSKNNVYSAILKSRTICNHIIDKNNLKEVEYFKKMKQQELIEMLQESIFTEVRKNGILEINIALSTPFFPNKEDKTAIAELTCNIVNSAVDGLDSLVRSQQKGRSYLSKDYIEREIHQYAIRLDSLERKLESYQSDNKILEMEEQFKLVMEQAVAVGSELGTAKVELDMASQHFQPGAPQLQSLLKKYNTLAEQYEKIQSGGMTESDAYGISLNDIPKMTREYTALYRDRKIIEEVMLYLETLRHQEAISIAKEMPSITVLDPAIVPEKKSAPKFKIMYIFAAVFGGLGAYLWAIIDAAKKGLVTIRREDEE